MMAHNTVNILKTMELYILNGWIALYMNYLSRHLLKKKPIQQSSPTGNIFKRSSIRSIRSLELWILQGKWKWVSLKIPWQTHTRAHTHIHTHDRQRSRELAKCCLGGQQSMGHRMEPRRGPHLFHLPHWVQALLGRTSVGRSSSAPTLYLWRGQLSSPPQCFLFMPVPVKRKALEGRSTVHYSISSPEKAPGPQWMLSMGKCFRGPTVQHSKELGFWGWGWSKDSRKRTWLGHDGNREKS